MLQRFSFNVVIVGFGMGGEFNNKKVLINNDFIEANQIS